MTSLILGGFPSCCITNSILKTFFLANTFLRFAGRTGRSRRARNKSSPSLYTLIIPKHFEFPSQLFSLLPSTTSLRNRFHHHFALVPLPQRTAFHLILAPTCSIYFAIIFRRNFLKRRPGCESSRWPTQTSRKWRTQTRNSRNLRIFLP